VQFIGVYQDSKLWISKIQRVRTRVKDATNAEDNGDGFMPHHKLKLLRCLQPQSIETTTHNGISKGNSLLLSSPSISHYSQQSSETILVSSWLFFSSCLMECGFLLLISDRMNRFDQHSTVKNKSSGPALRSPIKVLHQLLLGNHVSQRVP
jgi:hypothetical protein